MSIIEPISRDCAEGTSGGDGVTVHNLLSGRSAANAHPTSSITGLDTALSDLSTAISAGDAAAVPKSLFDANTMIYATADNTPLALTVGASRFVGRKASGDIAALTPTEANALLTPWTGAVDADGFNLQDVGTLSVGNGGAPATGVTAAINGTYSAQSIARTSLSIAETVAYTTGGVAYTTISATPAVSITTGQTIFAIGVSVAVTATGAGNVLAGNAGLFTYNANNTGTNTTATGTSGAVAVGAGATVSTAIGVSGSITATGTSAVVTTGVGVDIASSASGGSPAAAITTMIGLRILAASLAGGTTKWAMNIGDINSFHEGKMRFGATAAASTTAPAARLEVIEPTIGNRVAQFGSVSTADDPTEWIQHARGTTTDGNITTIGPAVNVPTSTSMLIVAYVTARRTGGASGAAEDGAAYLMRGLFKNTAGTVAQIGAGTVEVVGESQAGWDIVWNANAATARVRATGATSNDVTWHVSFHCFIVAA